MNYYLHIPFCRQKCPYCKFALTPIFTELKKRRYIEYLKKEIREYFLSSWVNTKDLSWRPADLSTSPEYSGSARDDKKVNTIYFWWGTPSILTLDEVRSILECFPAPSPWWEGWGEVTYECNPEDITSEYVAWILALGTNRLSIGIQSLNDQTLKAIHRSNRESILRALETIKIVIARSHSVSVNDDVAIQVSEKRSTGLLRASQWPRIKPSNIPTYQQSLNIDLILGLPFSRPWETLANIRELHEAFPHITHTSVYMLEDGHYPKDWKWESITEEEMQEDYRTICEYFDSIGWHHYEISNWSKPGYESVHNRWYWDHTNTRAFGLSGTSYVDGRRWTNASSFSGYYAGKNESEEILNGQEIHLEKIIHWLRTFSLDEAWFTRDILNTLKKNGDIHIIDGKIILTPAWIFRENFILGELVDEGSSEKYSKTSISRI